MTAEMLSYEELVALAFEELGTSLGTSMAQEYAAKAMMKKYALTIEEAEVIVTAAYDEWLDAYE
jgi:hypothetical protein